MGPAPFPPELGLAHGEAIRRHQGPEPERARAKQADDPASNEHGPQSKTVSQVDPHKRHDERHKKRMINGINAFSSPSLHREGAWIERNKANQGDNENEKTKIDHAHMVCRSDSREKKGNIISIGEIK